MAGKHPEIPQVLGKPIKALSAITLTGKLHISVPHIHHNHTELLVLAAFSPRAKTIGARFISLAPSSAASARDTNTGKKRDEAHTE